jgi:hypothetical protein
MVRFVDIGGIILLSLRYNISYSDKAPTFTLQHVDKSDSVSAIFPIYFI